MLSTKPRKLTVEEFIRDYSDLEEKYELIEGEAWAMAGASKRHNRIAQNIFTALHDKLRGGQVRVFGPGSRLLIDTANIRFPDVAVSSDPRDAHDDFDSATFSDPELVVEVLSPASDRIQTLLEYKSLPSLRTLVWVVPEWRMIDVSERVSSREWLVTTLAPDVPLILRDLDVTLSRDEIFEDA